MHRGTVATARLTQPRQSTFGDSGHNILGGPGAATVDFSAFRTISMKDRAKLFEALKDPASALNALLQMGSIYEGTGEVARAREALAECRATARKVRFDPNGTRLLP